MNMKNLNPVKWLALFLLIGSINANAKDILPDDIVLHLSTANLGVAISGVEEFASECTQGTPLAPYTQPGCIKKLIPIVTDMDMQRPCHVLMANPKDHSELEVGFFLPLVNATEALEKLATDGKIGKHKDGSYRVVGMNMCLIMARDDYAVLADSTAIAEKMKSIFNSWKKPFATKKGFTLTATVDVQKIMRLNAALIEESKVELKDDIIRSVKRDKDMAGLEVAVPAMLEEVIKLAQQVNATRINLTINKSKLDIQGFVSSKKDSEIRKLAGLYSKHKPDYVNLKKLPGKFPVSYSSYSNNEISTLCRGIVMRCFVTPMLQVEKVKPYKTTILKAVDLFSHPNGESAFGASFSRDSMYSFSYILAVNDSKKAMAATRSLLADVSKLVTEFTTYIKSPVNCNFKYTQDAGRVEELSYDLFNYSFSVNEKMKDKISDIEILNLKKMQEDLPANYAMVPMDNKTIVVSLAKDYSSSISKLVKGYRAEVPNTHQLADLLSEMKYNQISGCGIYLLDYLKGYALMMAKMMPKSEAQPMNIFKQYVPIVETLPSSTTPILTTYGATRKNLCMEFKMPTKVIKEVANAAMQAYMKAQVMKVNSK